MNRLTPTFNPVSNPTDRCTGQTMYTSASTCAYVRTDSRRKLWPCATDPTPVGITAESRGNAGRLTFSIRAVSAHLMLVLADASEERASARTRFTAVTVFPGVGGAHVKLEVLTVLPPAHGESGLKLLCRICDPTRTALEAIGQYLLQSGPWVTNAELAEAGLRVKSLAHGVEIGLAASAAERRQAYALRHLAYAGAGKVSPDATQVFCDAHDRRAKIVVARHKGEVVASLRLMFHGPDESFEHEAYTSLPASVDRQRTTEITRICTHPGFRGGDLLRALLQFSALEVVRVGRPIVLGSATRKLLPLYERIGMRATGHAFAHGELAGLEHRLVVGNAQRVLAGRGVGPLVWNLMWAAVWDRAVQTGVLEPRSIDRARVASYRMIAPLARPAARRERK